MRAGELTPAEGKRLFAEYEKAKEGMDRHLAEVKEIEAQLERKLQEMDIDNRKPFTSRKAK